MDIIGAFSFVIGIGLLTMSFFAWQGRLDLFPDSIRLNHAGVLMSSGLFCAISGGTNLYIQLRGVPLSFAPIIAVAWITSFCLFIWMYASTPQRLTSRMYWVSKVKLPDLAVDEPFKIRTKKIHDEKNSEITNMGEGPVDPEDPRFDT